MGFGMAAGSIFKSTFAKTIGAQITSIAGKFIAGLDAASAFPTLKSLWKEGMAFSVDLLGEASLSEPEAEEYQNRYLDLVENGQMDWVKTLGEFYEPFAANLERAQETMEKVKDALGDSGKVCEKCGSFHEKEQS